MELINFERVLDFLALLIIPAHPSFPSVGGLSSSGSHKEGCFPSAISFGFPPFPQIIVESAFFLKPPANLSRGRSPSCVVVFRP